MTNICMYIFVKYDKYIYILFGIIRQIRDDVKYTKQSCAALYKLLHNKRNSQHLLILYLWGDPRTKLQCIYISGNSIGLVCQFAHIARECYCFFNYFLQILHHFISQSPNCSLRFCLLFTSSAVSYVVSASFFFIYTLFCFDLQVLVPSYYDVSTIFLTLDYFSRSSSFILFPPPPPLY